MEPPSFANDPTKYRDISSGIRAQEKRARNIAICRRETEHGFETDFNASTLDFGDKVQAEKHAFDPHKHWLA